MSDTTDPFERVVSNTDPEFDPEETIPGEIMPAELPENIIPENGRVVRHNSRHDEHGYGVICAVSGNYLAVVWETGRTWEDAVSVTILPRTGESR